MVCRRNSPLMDSCQLIRRETKVEVVHFNQRQLAARWDISEATLGRWRSDGIGPSDRPPDRVRDPRCAPCGSCARQGKANDVQLVLVEVGFAAGG